MNLLPLLTSPRPIAGILVGCTLSLAGCSDNPTQETPETDPESTPAQSVDAEGTSLRMTRATPAATPTPAPTPDPKVVNWNFFVKHFINNGRVIDTGNGGISHSEGQGYGMLIAEARDDRAVFDDLWEWTKANLGKRDDRLFCWKWAPNDTGDGGSVTDSNNATDGDMLIAWALLRGAERWQAPEYVQAAEGILEDVLKLCTLEHANRLLLLPGVEGFVKEDVVIVNLSYWIYPAIRDFYAHSQDDRWEQLMDVGLEFARIAKFSKYQLPPDWLAVHPRGLDIASGWQPDYGYNAVRVPLHLLWAGVLDERYIRSYRLLAEAVPNLSSLPATVDLVTGAFGESSALPGMAAIYRLVQNPIQFRGEAAPYPGPMEQEAYFSVSLGLLCNIASEEEKKYPPPTEAETP